MEISSNGFLATSFVSPQRALGGVNTAEATSFISTDNSGSSGRSANPLVAEDSQAFRPVSAASDTESAQNNEQNLNDAREQRQLQQEQDLIRQLASRDREVRAHEQAHAAVGGRYAGAPQYQFQRGPDGVNYAVGGEVPIDISKEATPQETIQKMQIVRRAALAPAEPSGQDRRVAAQASASEAEARAELLQVQRDEQVEADDETETDTSDDVSESGIGASDETAQAAPISTRSDVSSNISNNVSSIFSAISSSNSLSSPRSGLIIDQRA